MMRVAGGDAVPRTKLLRILIPLSGSESDASALRVAAEMAPRDAQIFLLHARPGPDEEQYPDLKPGPSEAEGVKRRLESESIFAQANAILASRGLTSADQVTIKGKPAEAILRYANHIGAELIVLTAGGAGQVLDRATCAVLVARSGMERKN